MSKPLDIKYAYTVKRDAMGRFTGKPRFRITLFDLFITASFFGIAGFVFSPQLMGLLHRHAVKAFISMVLSQ